MSQPEPSIGKKRRIKGARKAGLLIAFLFSLNVPLILSAVGLFLSAWIVIPAPTLSLLILGVGAPEVSPWLLGLNIISAVVSLAGLHKSWLNGIALGCSLVGLLLSTLPLVQLPTAIDRSTTAFHAALGKDYTARIPQEVQAQWRTQPFVLIDAFRGIPAREFRYQADIPFAAPDGVQLRLNVYQPMQVGNHPTIVVIYGGAWREGTPSNDATFSQYMAARGYTVVAIDYRHAPQHPFPAQIEDVRTAFTFIQQHADKLEVDLDRVAVMGRSAGAHLAMLAAYQPSALRIKGVVNYYGPVDLAAGYNDLPSPDPINTQAVLRAFLGGTPTERPDLYRQASPISYVTQPLPPSLLVYAQRDHLVQAKFGKALYDRLQATGTRAVWLEIPWAEHAFDAVFNGVSNQLALYYTERFLAWTLRGSDLEGGYRVE